MHVALRCISVSASYWLRQQQQDHRSVATNVNSPKLGARILPPPQDAKLAKLDNMDEDDLDKLREKRKAQLIAAQKIKQVRKCW